MSKTTVNTAGHTDKLISSIGRSTVFGVVARVAQALTRLVTVPIVIAHLGLGGYGIWSIIMAAAAYMRFGSIGIKSAFQKYVAEATGTKDFETTNKLLSTGCALMLVLSLAGLVPIAVFSRKLAVLAGVPPEFLGSAANSFTVLAIIMVMSNVGAAYEAIVMGGHRIDLSRNLATYFTVAEAGAILVLLHFGGGLLAMASVMAASELGFVASCYVASKKVVPEIRLGMHHVDKGVLRELLRFGGSYQVANVMQVFYLSIVPVTLLRMFGADAAGIYALTYRLVSSAMMLPDAFILPILSGAAMVFAVGSAAEIRTFINKSYKVTLALGLFAMLFIAIFGTMIVYAWTGEHDSNLRVAFWLISAAGLCQSFSTLGLVLYRASGRVLLDNIRLVSQIVVLLVVAVLGRHLGFYGVLAGMASAELFGMVFMLFAITEAFDAFSVKSLLLDSFRLAGAIAIVVSAAAIA